VGGQKRTTVRVNADRALIGREDTNRLSTFDGRRRETEDTDEEVIAWETNQR